MPETVLVKPKFGLTEAPQALNALMLYQYVVVRARPVFVYVTLLAVLVAIMVHGPLGPTLLLQTLKPCSLVALSVQEMLIELRVVPTTVRFVGVAGTAQLVGVTAFEGFDAGPGPTAFVARTVKV